MPRNRLLVALAPMLDLLVRAKHLFVAAMVVVSEYSVHHSDFSLFSPAFWNGVDWQARLTGRDPQQSPASLAGQTICIRPVPGRRRGQAA
jgi:hypothetical protein